MFYRSRDLIGEREGFVELDLCFNSTSFLKGLNLMLEKVEMPSYISRVLEAGILLGVTVVGFRFLVQSIVVYFCF